MARIESVEYSLSHATVCSTGVAWSASGGTNSLSGVPMVFWQDGTPWREANVWLCQQAFSDTYDIKTVQSKASALLTYTRWLEKNNVSWCSFPERKDERCLNRFRGALVLMRNEGQLAPSTTSSKLRVVIQFYKWMMAEKIIQPSRPLWITTDSTVHFSSTTGSPKTRQIGSTGQHG